MSENTVDVLVVGAGPVGLFCANELHRYGLSCRIIDKKEAISTHSKALGLHIRTLDVLADAGIIEAVLAQGHRVNGAVFKSHGQTLLTLTFKDLAATRHFLIDLPQNQTEAILEQSLKDKGIEVEWHCEFTHFSQTWQGICATLNKPDFKVELLHADWIMACDGAHSTARHLTELAFNGSEYPQRWWLADVHIVWAQSDSFMTIYITEEGPMACFPMGNHRYRLVLSMPADATGDPDLNDIQQAFNQRSSDVGIICDPVWLSAFSIHHRQIESYRYDRLFFAGDAAHIHSPMGGQGLNTGLQDIYNWVWKIALVKNNKAKPELLETYHDERFPVGQSVLKKTDLMTKMMVIKNPLLIRWRNRMMQLLGRHKAISQHIANDLSELDIAYVHSPLTQKAQRFSRLKPGYYMPLFELNDAITQDLLSSFELTQGTDQHLFLFMGRKPKLKQQAEWLACAEQLMNQYHGLFKVHCVVEDLKTLELKRLTPSFNVLIDTQFKVHQAFGMRRSGMMWVRPDKYTSVVHSPIKPDILWDYCKKWFIETPVILEEAC